MTVDQTGDLDRWCQKSPSQYHAAEKRNGVVKTPRDGRTGVCRHCGNTIHRAHRKSAVWWVDWSDPKTK